MYLDEQANRIKESELECTGCSMDAIYKHESLFNIKIPIAYKEFLAICGQEKGQLFCGNNIEIDTWSYMNKYGRESFKAALGRECPKNIFFIMEHHGYSYYYIDLNEGENPDIWLLIHGDEITNEPIGKIETILSREIDKQIKNKRTITSATRKQGH